MQMRVRVSAPSGTVAVKGKGSAFIVNDSKATARVLVAWLIRIGFLLVAALAAVKVQTNKTNWEDKNSCSAARKAGLHTGWAPSRFPKDFETSGEVLHSLEGPPWLVTQVGVNIPSFISPLIGLLDEWNGEIV